MRISEFAVRSATLAALVANVCLAQEVTLYIPQVEVYTNTQHLPGEIRLLEGWKTTLSRWAVHPDGVALCGWSVE